MQKKIKLIVYILFSLMFINSGLNKFFNYLPVPENLPQAMKDMNEAFPKIMWLMPLAGAIEIIGGLLFLSKRSRALASIMLFPVMVGIILTHAIGDPSGIAPAILLLAILLLAMADDKEKLMGLIR